ITPEPSTVTPPAAAASAAPPVSPTAPPVRRMPMAFPRHPTTTGLPRRQSAEARLAPARQPSPPPVPTPPGRSDSPAAPADPLPVTAQRGTQPPGDHAQATAPTPATGTPPAEPPANDLNSRRVRVVLAERKGVARPVRTVVDIQEGTGVGELLRSNLIGSQLAVALRFAIGAGLTLGLLPLLFAMFPELGLIDILGLRLPWLLLGFLVYPFLLGLGWWHTRTAERVEQEFADHVQDN
ncbi:MAG TPA: hypothetical protein VNA11_12940, partial [Pseudonocardia sp.]|nr:hypothetical protein [Pseudonocardia sp.]